ncbi:hypothetical protein DBT_0184 [Dissulfuribacter thermophilus]|uniref:Uncharacterized protein n=1 Tax=Dissulfuribacter thermophilus TaxID=1156395 RepID=A0A1B9F8U6_9BACT|nr:hypothetical protein DBT_0184 [Dissulfuribacter thermophilus]
MEVKVQSIDEKDSLLHIYLNVFCDNIYMKEEVRGKSLKGAPAGII